MELQFVDNSKIDVRTRKQIRSQVMKGKNAGKKRERIKHERRKLAVLTSKSLMPNEQTSKSSDSDDDSVDRAIALSSKNWNNFDGFRYPGELETYMRNILHSFFLSAGDGLYPKALCRETVGAHAVFFELFQADEAFFYCLLAIAEGHRHVQAGDSGVSDFALKCLANTYRCINKDLAENRVPSYGTVASVMSLVMHESLFGIVRVSRLHLEALERMVKLKGGLRNFERHPALLHKICRSDLEFALHVGAQPRLFRDAYPRTEVNNVLANLAVGWVGEPNLVLEDPVTKSVFNDCMNASRVLNSHPKDSVRSKGLDRDSDNARYRLHSFSFQEILISIGYRLLRAHPLRAPSTINAVDNACYLSLLALVTSMMIRSESGYHQRYDLLGDKLRSAITQLDSSNLPFKFWVCYVAGISVLNSDTDRRKLTYIVRHISQQLNIKTTAEARAMLMQFPWVCYFHDAPSFYMYNSVYA